MIDRQAAYAYAQRRIAYYGQVGMWHRKQVYQAFAGMIVYPLTPIEIQRRMNRWHSAMVDAERWDIAFCIATCYRIAAGRFVSDN